jgi:mycothiol synthase
MQDHEIRPFQLRLSSEADYACLTEFKNILRLEVLPDDPPISCLENVQRWQAMQDYIQEAAWVAWESPRRRIIAFAEAKIYHTGDNEHVIEFNVEVLPEFRRQGLARQLLRLIADHAERHNRRLMIVETNGRVPAGAEFLSRIGARKGLEQHLNQLRLAELDRDLIQRWLEASSHLSDGFRLGWWDGRFPDARIKELADLMQVVANDEPRDTLEMEDMIFTPDILRQFENQILAGGQQRWVLYAAEREHDRIAGLTEVSWNPDRPALLWQGFTAVLPEYRRRGLGRWLKAEMLNRVLRDRLQVEVIRTGNANSNAPMLKINVDLGFKPFDSWTVWQVATEAVGEYLAAHP